MREDSGGVTGSRARLLAAARALFARHGYEQTSTATIAREAATSESQLVRYFGGKAGLLETIFDEGWAPVNERVQALVADTPSPRAALESVVGHMLEVFTGDADLAFLVFFEARRLRGEGQDIRISKGFRTFAGLVGDLVHRGREAGELGTGLREAAVRAALLGAVEAMARERFLAGRNGSPSDVMNAEEIRAVFAALLDGLSQKR